MIAVDTDVLVRLLIVDDTAQSEKARAKFEQGGVLILKTVLLETEWVLRARCKLERARIAGFFGDLAETAGIELEHDIACRAAIHAYASGMPFADALHAASAGALDMPLHTFDEGLRRKARRLKGVDVRVL